MFCFNYINSFNYLKINYVKYFNCMKSYKLNVYRIDLCFVSTALTPSSTWKSIMLTTSTAWNTTNWLFTEYILFQLHKLL